MTSKADQILDELRSCKTIADVNSTAKKYGEAVKLLAADPQQKVRAIHIKNMAAYMRAGIAWKFMYGR